MTKQSLEDALQRAGSAIELLRNSQIGPYVYPVVPTEFTNWRDEQRAWRETCVLFYQSHHMTDMYVKGPDALKLFSNLGINSFANFPVNRAKQFVACNYDGYVIGDAILFHLDTDLFNLVGRPSAHNWVQFHAETGGYKVSIERDERSAARQGPIVRKVYRYQVQGPTAPQVLQKLSGGRPTDLKFFHMGEMTIAGRKVRTLRHGMAGQPGLELFGPWADGDAVRDAIIEAGREFGLKQCGSRAYATNTLESGWIPSPLPAIYSGEKMKPYRQWLPANSYEGTASLGGSYYAKDVSDYYLTPYELGYGMSVKFDHDFIGREALERMADKQRRRKVTLAWNADDVARVFRSMFEPGRDPFKYIDLPLSNYASSPYDRVMKGGRMVGISTFNGCSYNERAMLSLAIVDNELSKPGTEVTLVWGEEGGGSSRPVVERHVQTEIRATVGPVPYSRDARETYATGWRTAQR
jgi:vanillate/3-O-methylgallate O-demethylase